MPRISSSKMKELLKVYFIMGSNNSHQQPLQVIKEAIDGGITLFQFREKGVGALKGREKFQFAKELQAICQQSGVPFIVNDDVELALALNADGVHIGQEDESAISVRQRIGDKILGVSVHNIEQTYLAIEQGADYVGLGPVFPTNTKEDAKEVQGTTLIKALKENNVQIPIVGIGGITAENAKQVIEAGADGVSVITAISLAESVIESTKKLKEAVYINI